MPVEYTQHYEYLLVWAWGLCMYVSIYLPILLGSSFFLCASTTSKPVLPEFEITTHDVVSGRSADDLALALSERPEYAEIFNIFVSLQIMMQEQKSLKIISRMAQQLRSQIVFVQKYASDPLLDEILAWCQAQKGLGKKMAAWKKVLIAAAVAVSVLGISAYGIRKRAQYKQGLRLVGAGRGVVGRQQIIPRWSHVNIARRDPLGGFSPDQLSSLVLNAHSFGVTIDTLQNSTPFFTEWKDRSGSLIRGDISSFSYCPNDSIPSVLKQFLQSAEVRSILRRIGEQGPLKIKGIGLFLSKGTYYCSLSIGSLYFLWRVGESVFIPINLGEARKEGRLEDEIVTSSMTYEEIKTVLQRYRNRRYVYENTAIVVFYTTRADFIRFMVTPGDQDSCGLVM